MLVFGYTSDKWSRRNSLLVATVIMIVFTALCAGAYGGGTLTGMIAALTAFRFLVGIGIGGEYPAGSVAAAESSGEVKAGTRNMWFIMFTNVAIDWGFVIGAFVPYVLVLIFTESHLRATWRVALGLGVIPPIVLLLMRLRLQEPEQYKRESMKHVKIPYGLVLKYYWFRLFVVGLIWFLYDVCQAPIPTPEKEANYDSSPPTPSASTRPPSSALLLETMSLSRPRSAGTPSSTSSTSPAPCSADPSRTESALDTRW
jgi:MFS family permease